MISPLKAYRHRFDDLHRRAARRIQGNDYRREDGVCRLAPEWLVLVVNNVCNLHCKMCDVGLGESASVFYTHLVGENPRNMSLGLLETILDQAASFSPRPKIGLAYTEPLIHKDIVAMIRAITRRGFYCSLTTNGYTLPHFAEDLVAVGVDEIVISVDGPEEIHDRIRGRKGSFRKLSEGAGKVREVRSQMREKRPVFRFSYTLTDENFTHMVEFVRQVETLQPASFCFSHLNFITDDMAAAHNAVCQDAWTVSRSNLGTMDLAAIDLADLWRALEELQDYAGKSADFPDLILVPDLVSLEDLEIYYRQPLRFIGGRRCQDPWRMMMVRTDGTVIPAHGRCYNVPVGRVTETPLRELWNHGLFRDFRTTLKEVGGTLPACSRCCGVINAPKA